MRLMILRSLQFKYIQNCKIIFWEIEIPVLIASEKYDRKHWESSLLIKIYAYICVCVYILLLLLFKTPMIWKMASQSPNFWRSVTHPLQSVINEDY